MTAVTSSTRRPTGRVISMAVASIIATAALVISAAPASAEDCVLGLCPPPPPTPCTTVLCLLEPIPCGFILAPPCPDTSAPVARDPHQHHQHRKTFRKGSHR